MSGTPKYCQAQLDRQRRERLEQERRRQAAEEARRRREAEERERRRRFEELRAGLVVEINAANTGLVSRRNEMYTRDATELSSRCEKLLAAVQSASNEKDLRTVPAQIRQILHDGSEAAAHKRRDEEEKKRIAELDRQRFQLSEAERKLSDVPSKDSKKFDPRGLDAASAAIVTARESIAAGHPESAKAVVRRAAQLVDQHFGEVNRCREEWLHRRNDAVRSAGELRAHIEGLRADPVLLRWHGKSISGLEDYFKRAESAVENEAFDEPSKLLTEVQKRSTRLVDEANQAQIKADQRDYIVHSIAQTLQAMNFTVSPPSPEHGSHPASAILFQAVSGSNKAINVSVPFEGQIMYSVDGYPMSTEAIVGRGTAAVCDEAERVLTEMQRNVQSAFGVTMGEIMWEGKDPDRLLRKADELPRGSQEQTRGHR